MRNITLSGKSWVNVDDFWDDLFEAIGAPKWHGRNLNALHDSVHAGSINKIEAPYRIVIRDAGKLPMSVAFLLFRIDRMAVEWQREGTQVEICFEGDILLGLEHVAKRKGDLHLNVLEILRDWDPIGVYETRGDWPDDEYESYALKIIELLKRDKKANEIAEHLGKLMTLSMGLRNVRPDWNLAIAHMLIEAYESTGR